MLTGRPLAELDLRDVIGAMTRCYGVDETAAEFALLGDEASVGSCAFVRGVRPSTRAPLDAAAFVDGTILPTGGTAYRVLEDLCARGELAPGDYVVRWT